MKLSFGERNWVIFDSKSDFFVSLGFLSNNKRGVYISSETSSNRWGTELRIWIEDATNMPIPLANADSKGLNSYERRINCNEYVHYIVSNFGFNAGKYQNSNFIRSIVAINFPVYLQDFDFGYNL